MAQRPRKEAELNFTEWLDLNENRGTSNKTGLYPLGYGGIGLYPPQDYLTHSADAITYLSMDARIYKGRERKPFDITHLSPFPTFTHPEPPLPKHKTPSHFYKPGGIVAPRDERAPGKSVKPKGHQLPGEEKKPKKVR